MQCRFRSGQNTIESMPNQRDIAKVAGVSQVAVSLALRGDHSVSARLTQRIQSIAREMGYRPNPYVSTLMSHIRTSRKPKDTGEIAVIVDMFRKADWLRHESYRVYYRGLSRRSAELGFHPELYSLMESGMTPKRIDHILQSRGVHGVILAPPYRGNRRLPMQWDKYACIGTGYGWERQQFDRVAHDHDQNMIMAFEQLAERGYRRIGVSIPSFFASGRGTRWLDGFLVCQDKLPAKQRIPLFIGSVEEQSLAAFRRWHSRWRPDALLTLYGHEMSWLKTMKLKVPLDVAVACVIRPPGSSFAGIDDHYDEIGAITAELIASKLAFNHYGIPAKPRLTLIEGHWVDGPTAPRRKS
jgi:LacI family transcriptional regulator